jgi:hypothetical protein
MAVTRSRRRRRPHRGCRGRVGRPPGLRTGCMSRPARSAPRPGAPRRRRLGRRRTQRGTDDDAPVHVQPPGDCSTSLIGRGAMALERVEPVRVDTCCSSGSHRGPRFTSGPQRCAHWASRPRPHAGLAAAMRAQPGRPGLRGRHPSRLCASSAKVPPQRSQARRAVSTGVRRRRFVQVSTVPAGGRYEQVFLHDWRGRVEVRAGHGAPVDAAGGQVDDVRGAGARKLVVGRAQRLLTGAQKSGMRPPALVA